MEQVTQRKSSGFPIFGIFLIVLGIGIILNKTNILHYKWTTILWICFGIIGLAAVVRAFIIRKRSDVFWGSFVFFISCAVIANKLVILDFVPWDYPATFSIALGLSFLVLFVYDPFRPGVLIPALFFCSYGVLYYLWLWDIIEWFDVKNYIKTYWPVLVIIWGLSILLQRRK